MITVILQYNNDKVGTHIFTLKFFFNCMQIYKFFKSLCLSINLGINLYSEMKVFQILLSKSTLVKFGVYCEINFEKIALRLTWFFKCKYSESSVFNEG